MRRESGWRARRRIYGHRLQPTSTGQCALALCIDLCSAFAFFVFYTDSNSPPHWWVCSHVFLHCNATQVGVMHILQPTSGQGTVTSYFKSLLPSMIVWTLCSHFRASTAQESSVFALNMCNATRSASYLYKCNIASSSSQSLNLWKSRDYSLHKLPSKLCSVHWTSRHGV